MRPDVHNNTILKGCAPLLGVTTRLLLAFTLAALLDLARHLCFLGRGLRLYLARRLCFLRLRLSRAWCEVHEEHAARADQNVLVVPVALHLPLPLLRTPTQYGGTSHPQVGPPWNAVEEDAPIDLRLGLRLVDRVGGHGGSEAAVLRQLFVLLVLLLTVILAVLIISILFLLRVRQAPKAKQFLSVAKVSQ